MNRPEFIFKNKANSAKEIQDIFCINDLSGESMLESIPYCGGGVTCGIENEFQTAVSGRPGDVDLPIYITDSSYLKNLEKRVARGDASRKNFSRLMTFLENNSTGLWENSWVRFPASSLSRYAATVFDDDLKADKSIASSPPRGDRDRFLFKKNGRDYIRVPVSYLLKLALADAISGGSFIHPVIRSAGTDFMKAFMNDNTSPEIVSFFPVQGKNAGETAEMMKDSALKQYLLTQLLIIYANKKFELTGHGQEVSLYFSPHPPLRQKKLNDLIPDSFYREIFMSPCLSGWNRGEEKHNYMIMCHQMLSRSYLNSALKLRESGIISRNMVYLKGISNISLANNGTHISIGSIRLNEMLNNPSSTYTGVHEKYYGDLAVKIYEHFIPLFSGVYSADPYRLNFQDFYPEKVLGFLSHELDFTHLRMLWREWKDKARLKVLGNPLTPFGPEWMERLVAGACRLKGDFVGDYRLIDYFVSLLSTDESPSLNGEEGNDKKLKADLASQGVFDTSMSFYSFYRQRILKQNGYTGFEGRYYSLFESIGYDFKNAAALQILITAFAYKQIILSDITHDHIPDNPEIESERRQAVFSAAIGLPYFFVQKKNRNLFLKKILSYTGKIVNSSRYQGYVKVSVNDYRRALVRMLRSEGADLIEKMGMENTVRDLEERLDNPEELFASARLTKGILLSAGLSTPIKAHGNEFNAAAEEYYRKDLRIKHIEEAFDIIEKDADYLKQNIDNFDSEYRRALNSSCDINNIKTFIKSARNEVKDGTLPLLYIRSLIHLIILIIRKDNSEVFSSESDKDLRIRLTV